MLAKSSADSRPPARSAAAHQRLVAALSARHRPLAADGFEHHLFCTGEEVLKVYRWFRAADLSLEAERAVRDGQRWLHEVYAPRLAARVVALDADGEECPPDSARACCYALAMRLGEPIPADTWRRRAADWSGRAGSALAHCHGRAPRACFDSSDRAGALARVLLAAARVYDAERPRFPVEGPLAELIRIHAVRLAAGTRAARGGQVVVSHGDLNTGNLIVSAGEVQFIDTGLAMPAGVGLDVEVPFDGGWDVALLGQSLALFGGRPAARRFVRGYAFAAAVDRAVFASDLRYWRALALVLTLAATMRYSAELLDPARPFAPRRLPGFRLETYVKWLVASLSRVLAAPHRGAAANWTRYPEE